MTEHGFLGPNGLFGVFQKLMTVIFTLNHLLVLQRIKREREKDKISCEWQFNGYCFVDIGGQSEMGSTGSS